MKKEIAIGVGVIIAIVLVAIAIQWYTAPFRGELSKREKIEASGEWKIAKYNHFFDLCAAIKGNYKALKAQEELLEQTTDTKEKQRIRQNIAGIKIQLHRDIEQYNADVEKEYTAGQMRDSGLPYKISMAKLERGEIRCK